MLRQLGHLQRRTTVALALAAVLVSHALIAPPGGAAPATLAAPDLADKRAEAEALQRAIDRTGERLSVATEEYNEAALKRRELESRHAELVGESKRAQAAYDRLRLQLGQRARQLYKRPMSWASPWFDSTSLGEVMRGHAFAGTVFETDANLLLDTQRARAAADELAVGVAASAETVRSQESTLAERRREASRMLTDQRGLLERVNGEIAEIRREQERARVAEAARRAEAEARRAARRQAAAAARTADRPSSSVEPRSGRTTDAARGAPGAVTTSAPAPKAGASKAVATAVDQLGKPYEWGAEGPDSFDCSGLTMYAWSAAGVRLPHSSRAQYSSLPKVALEDIRPGDLLFYGNPIHHVGIYEGNGVMINAPQTGETVRRASIYRKDFTGAARP